MSSCVLHKCLLIEKSIKPRLVLLLLYHSNSAEQNTFCNNVLLIVKVVPLPTTSHITTKHPDAEPTMTKSGLLVLLRASSLPNLNRKFYRKRISLADSSRRLVPRTVSECNISAPNRRPIREIGDSDASADGKPVVEFHRRSTTLTQRLSLTSAVPS